VPPVLKPGILNLLQPSGPVQASAATDFSLPFTSHRYFVDFVNHLGLKLNKKHNPSWAESVPEFESNFIYRTQLNRL
jgi:hypothetical protein